MRRAHVLDGVVRELIDGEDEAVAALYHSSFLADCHPCCDDVREDWTFDGETFAPPAHQEGQSLPSLDAVRISRNAKLVDCDWTQMPDALPAPKRKAWTEYRQALRDFPDTVTDLSDVVWPKQPS